ncbi:four-helix bundle copper-binding protein [Nocardiopsis sp. RSe5-2]|uniref:Four-helix bundle copper-binding protein n=1 Tax=Nocardiopsis endophytica TaxID=3018445 RepID=A0ABT4U3M5_9ACTN|nr:four-helix bundle copper-binding protein [Nocardiopsis endophytica]MDA2811562.1 four-helix bundle copper-binding protein [Nocardiopsis endophytica]
MPTQTQEFLRTHPRDVVGDAELLSSAIERLAACAQACVACADACLGERDAVDLVPCVRMNQDCADVCDATLKVLSRRTAADPLMQRALLSVCAEYCRACAEECRRHADRHEHCALCADTCMLCEDACTRLMARIG